MIMYKTTALWAKMPIVPVEVERVTESSVWIKGRRNSKITSYECYFNSFEEAKEYQLKLANSQLSCAQNNLQSAINTLEKVKSLQP